MPRQIAHFRSRLHTPALPLLLGEVTCDYTYIVLKYKLKQTIPNVMIAQGKGRFYILYKYAETLVINGYTMS